MNLVAHLRDAGQHADEVFAALDLSNRAASATQHLLIARLLAGAAELKHDINSLLWAIEEDCGGEA